MATGFEPKTGTAAAAVVPVVEVEALVKHFPGVRALDSLDLEILPGEVHAIVGQNGAGKSTLIKILAGLHDQTRGTIRIGGEQIDVNSPEHARRLGLSFVHQELALVSGYSIAENLFLGLPPPRRFGLISRNAQRAEARRALARIGLEVDVRRPVEELGVADRWLVVIARALLLDARALVLDEPTASLSDREVERLFDVIRRLRDDGVAIVYVSHRLDEVFAIAQRITVLKDGRKVATRLPAETSRQEIVSMMAGRRIEELYPRADLTTGQTVLSVRGLAGDGVHDVSFDLHAGEILGIAGLVGAGRTEAMELLAGLRQRTGGEIELDGESVRFKQPRDAISRGLVMLTEERSQSLILDRTIKDNISLPSLSNLVMSRWVPLISVRAERQLAAEQVKRLSVRCRSIGQPVKFLSGGNQQKVVLARWLPLDARIFIFDEPTHGIDIEGKIQIYQLMETLAQRGASVIFISSELPELINIATRIVVMREGRTAGDLATEDLAEEELLHHCYGEEGRRSGS